MSDEMERNPGPGAATGAIDGKLYIDALVKAGERSRAYIYFILILVVLTFTSIRNGYSPDWMNTRMRTYQDLYRCLKANDLNKPECISFKEGAERAFGDSSDIAGAMWKEFHIQVNGKFGDPDFVKNNEAVMDEIKTKMQSFTDKEVETYTITIPLLGSYVDVK